MISRLKYGTDKPPDTGHTARDYVFRPTTAHSILRRHLDQMHPQDLEGYSTPGVDMVSVSAGPGG